MATLQKFKLLATQCAVAGSPTRSPTTSPVIHLRRRKTLRMLLGGGRRWPARERSPDRRGESPEKGKEMVVRHKLKDLFVSSPPPPPIEEERRRMIRGCDDVDVNVNIGEGFLPATGFSGGGVSGRRLGPRSLRPLSAAFRQRLLRRPWRPVLVTIAE